MGPITHKMFLYNLGQKPNLPLLHIVWHNRRMMNRTDTKDPQPVDEWPNLIRNRNELDNALKDGEESGTATQNIIEVADQVLNRLKND